MKKLLAIVLVLALLLSFAACGQEKAATDSSDAVETKEAVKLIAASGFNDGHHFFEGSVYPVMDKLEETGDVEFETYLSGELVGHAAEYDALTDGVCDYAMSFCASYDAARFTLSDVMTLPAFNADMQMIDEALVAILNDTNATMDGQTFYEHEFTSKGLVATPNHMTDYYHIITCTANPASMDAYTSSTVMRCPTMMTTILAKDLGFSTVTMTISDAYDAMSKGAVSGMLMCADWKQYGLDTLYGYIITGINLGCAPTFMMMTEDTYNKLSDEAKDIFINYAQECTVTSGVQAVEENNNLNWESARSNGVEIIEYNDLPEDVQKHIEDASVQVWLDWIDQQEAAGYPAKAAAIVWRDCLKSVGTIVPDALEALESYTPNK